MGSLWECHRLQMLLLVFEQDRQNDLFLCRKESTSTVANHLLFVIEID